MAAAFFFTDLEVVDGSMPLTLLYDPAVVEVLPVQMTAHVV